MSKSAMSTMFNTAPTRILAPLPIRRTVNRPTQSAQADRAVLKDLSQDALTHYNMKDDWNGKVGQCWTIEIKGHLDASDSPTEYGKQQDSAKIYQAASKKWILSDATLSYTYSLSTAVIFIKAAGLCQSDCIGLAEEIEKVTINPSNSLNPTSSTQDSSLDLNSYLSMDGPMGIWGHGKKTNIISSDNSDSSDIEVMLPEGHSKRKLTDRNEKVPFQKKACLSTQSWPGKTCKLSELIIWCDKAPKGSVTTGVTKKTWYKIFGDRYHPDAGFKTPYKYCTWVLKKRSELIDWMASRPEATVKEATVVFRESFRQITSGRGGPCVAVVID
ncbi:uncharacterized protein MELLADRAFT_113664 [Melampsora larici-populina 98AG31]|uniref:Uncharacterized protein n=1 Tax=Melampsora larici-populina (strain 98AG31 / pathotype 3-4-7) TaxID=747676 RepID=F4SAN9_MELLP|nr:uncharacterized protein MELLADRAFT_113664 [Melampsora larici-populina 98AG31]EGF98300.1 hypothetical protein MELLADRAFT_113664 [Melampsora larici-populina 98AG31]